MTVLDAYAVVALLRAEPAATKVEAILHRGDAALTAVGVAEVLDHLIRIANADEEEAALDVAQLGLLDGVAVTAHLGAAAGRLRAQHYHRTRCAVSMADCIAAEVARTIRQALATPDPHLLDVCHAEGIDFVVLAQSDGCVWSASGRT
ncbi:PIN domain-containing protein [Sporichthya sp.]|uniref:PIN domain-containing protein n=1 Tax=Sporichthya sp. TaxID=65475 RepID=UPI001848AC12|nr:PIN domain-containing protein [Sporichthya sp.]MBA3745239.1 PIN domain-containing protein [Sporichthya sp.]